MHESYRLLYNNPTNSEVISLNDVLDRQEDYGTENHGENSGHTEAILQSLL